MASKLFHSIVGFGLAFGAASMGCVTESSDDTETTESDEAAQTAYGTDVTPPDDRYCAGAWPTTKGRPAPTCTDPSSPAK